MCALPSSMNAEPPAGAPAPLPTAANPHFRELPPSFHTPTFIVRRKILALFGAKLHIRDEAGNLLLFVKMKAFKLKEDITLYADEEMKKPLVQIRARKIIDLGSAYDVYDVSWGKEYHVGVLKRMALKSIFRDEWEIWNTRDEAIGKFFEESGFLAILRRLHELLSFLAPQKYKVTLSTGEVGSIQRLRNPFVMKLRGDFTKDPAGTFDRRLAMAAATLLILVEGSQS